MSVFSDNIRHLRIQKKFSQERLSAALEITRARYVKYESGISEASYELLRRIAHFYNISVDLLLGADLSKIDVDGLIHLDSNRLLLPIAVDKEGNNVIEIIPHKTRMGYLSGYSDPEFIEGLQQISLPFLKDGKFRAFPVSGDSMPPHTDRSFIIGRYVERVEEVKDGKTYVLITKSEGIVYKRINRKDKNMLMLSSDNTFYEPYDIKLSEVIEIWEYACSIATEEYEPVNAAKNIEEMFAELKREIRDMKMKIG